MDRIICLLKVGNYFSPQKKVHTVFSICGWWGHQPRRPAVAGVPTRHFNSSSIEYWKL